MDRDKLIEGIVENTHILKRGMYARMQAADVDVPVSHGQLELLFTIKHLQPISFKQLAQQLHLTRGAVSQLAEALAGASLIVRDIDQHDRRIQHLRLSDTGLALLDKIEAQRHDTMRQTMQSLTTQELATWLNIQEKIILTLTNPTK